MARRKNRKDKADHIAHGWAVTYRIGKAITSNFNLEEVLSLIGKIACAVTKSDAASVILVNIDASGISVGGSFGINKSTARSGPLEFEKAVLQHLASAKTSLLINDTASNPKFNRPALLKEGDFSSALCTPVIFNRRFLAGLILYSLKQKVYAKDHIKILAALAYQIALVIQNYYLYTNMHMNYFNTIKALVLAMEAKDPYTKGHSERVTEYALTIAGNMSLHPEQVQMIKYCGMLHDLGKIAISDSILNKRGSLTPSERIQIQRHPVEGAAVLSPLAFLRHGISLVRYHHERFDGTGYPDGLRGERIPIAARILACADAYDAMTSDRPYRSKLSPDMAIQELKVNSGTQFDPQVTNVFLKSLENSQ